MVSETHREFVGEREELSHTLSHHLHEEPQVLSTEEEEREGEKKRK